jgi:hypothetical protein
MRSDFTSGSPSSQPMCPAWCAPWIGESGGTYQTIGSVRYSGCSGKATPHSIAILYTGDLRAASSHSSGTPSARAWAITAGSDGSRKMSSCERYRCCSFSTLAASSIRSAS